MFFFSYKVQNTNSFLPPLTRLSRLTIVGLDRTDKRENLDSKVTERERSHQNVTDREETPQRP